MGLSSFFADGLRRPFFFADVPPPYTAKSIGRGRVRYRNYSTPARFCKYIFSIFIGLSLLFDWPAKSRRGSARRRGGKMVLYGKMVL